jgi:hypothetical protein
VIITLAVAAGIGMLSTKIAYWIHPLVKKTFFKGDSKLSVMIMPSYNDGKYGLALVMIM